jgi:hypothetical protein
MSPDGPDPRPDEPSLPAGVPAPRVPPPPPGPTPAGPGGDVDGRPDAGPSVVGNGYGSPGGGYVPPVSPPPDGPPPGYGYGPPPGSPGPGYGPPPGSPGPAYGPPPGYAAPGYGPPPGYTGPGYGPPPGYTAPGYGPPPGYGYATPPPGYGLKGGGPATGPLPLHPMSAGDVLDGVFKLLKANFRTIAVMIVILVVPLQILLAFVTRTTLGGHGILHAIQDPSVTTNTQRSVDSDLVQVAATILNWLLLPFLAGAIATTVAASYLGQQIGPKEAMRASLRRFWALFGAWWIHALTEYPAMVLLVFPGVCLETLFVMAAPAIVIEGLGPIAGLKRSWRLGARNFWPTMGKMLLTGLIASLLQTVLGGVPESVALLIGLKWGWILLALGSALVSLVVLPIAAITSTLLYFDARIRTEGFDLQVIAASLARSAG